LKWNTRRNKASFTTSKYMLADGSGDYIPVATTRPETIPGDTAVAVHPEDARYARFVGKKVIVPILGREIPVVADEYVTREFGTGALKITPGHDPHDYEIGQRHNLALINIMNKNATLNENAGKYAGMERFEARRAIWEDMTQAGLVLKEEPYLMNVPRSQRGGEIVEPLVSTQWFVKMNNLAAMAAESVRKGEITFVPDRFTKVFLNWMDNIQDWCISRQLWWGHRIPVWYCQDCHEVIVVREDPSVCPKCGSHNLQQDPDVLDTWFSSGLWPFSGLWLAGRDTGLSLLLPNQRAGDRIRHYFLLGCAHGHGRAFLHRQGALPYRLPARHGAR